MKVNLVKELVDFDQNPVLDQNQKPIVISKELANGLVRIPDKENPLKLWELSKKLYSATGAIDLDQSDIELIKTHLKGGNFTVGFAGQALEILAKEG